MNPAAPAYSEPHRPQVHFSPPSQWMNDPNGMVYAQGEYHLFYQYHPGSTVWGPMHWGHAVSRDLLHWEHLPVALEPDALGAIFSGSAIADHHNRSGLGDGQTPPLIAFFTYHDAEGERAGRSDYQTQGLAFSRDAGRTWIKYPGNPVLPNHAGIRDFRDPKVFRHEPSGHWIMALAAGDRVQFFRSPNLLDWSYSGEFGAEYGSHGGVWECPDLFPLPVDGGPEERWVLLLSINPGGPNGGSATQYFTGHFDGHTFRCDGPPEQVRWMDYGPDNYAGVTWSDVPDGRRLLMAWMSNWDYGQQVPTRPWRSAMTLPRVLSLRRAGGAVQLCGAFPEELAALRGRPQPLRTARMTRETFEALPLPFPAAPAELELDFTLETADAHPVLRLSSPEGHQVLIGYDGARGELYIDRSCAGPADFSAKYTGVARAPYQAGARLRFHAVLDTGSVELLAGGGAVSLTALYFAGAPLTQLSAGMLAGAGTLTEGTAWPLRSIWQNG
jgi:fructan beta-fructosidase